MVDNQKLINDKDTGQDINASSNPAVRSGVAVEAEKRYDDRNFKKSIRDMCAAVNKCLKDDLFGADAKWNVFIAACQSYRYDSCLKPFPPMFINSDNTKNIDLLLKAVDCVPAFGLLRKILSSEEEIKLNVDTIHLLYWVLVYLKEPELRSVPKEKFDEALSRVPCELTAQKPDFIFELKYNKNSAGSIKWKNYKHSYKTLYAYHGSRLENFHSILNHGLQSSLTRNKVKLLHDYRTLSLSRGLVLLPMAPFLMHLMVSLSASKFLCFKTTLFGMGVYLSSELLVSLPFSSTGFGWGKSMLGAELSVVALCEILDHPSTHCQNKGTNDKNRALASDSIAGEVPHKYYVVANSELIRIQYLLVYSRSKPLPCLIDPVPRTRNPLLCWIKDHKLLTAIMGYVFLLASVGLSNNQHVIRYYKMFINKSAYDQ